MNTLTHAQRRTHTAGACDELLHEMRDCDKKHGSGQLFLPYLILYVGFIGAGALSTIIIKLTALCAGWFSAVMHSWPQDLDKNSN